MLLMLLLLVLALTFGCGMILTTRDAACECTFAFLHLFEPFGGGGGGVCFRCFSSVIRFVPSFDMSLANLLLPLLALLVGVHSAVYFSADMFKRCALRFVPTTA